MAVDIPKSDRFVAWLAHNIEEVRGGDASYDGFPITLETRVRQYRTTISCLVLTFVTPSRLYVDGHDSHMMASLRCSVFSFLLGWWGFPWGPVYTVSSLIGNLFGGSKDTVANLIDEVTGHAKSVVQLTERGAELARRRIAEQGYPPETAILVRIADEFGPTYEIQFDMPESDGRQWQSESHGITILVDKDDEPKLQGLTIDERDGDFTFTR